MLGIVTGLKSEARILRGLDVRCISIGGKAAGAADKIDRLIAQGVTGLVSFGIAGALHPDLRCGDVVVAEAVLGPDGERWSSDSARLAELKTHMPAALPATILGLDRLLPSPAEKAAAFARTGALAVDMESHHVARAAAARGLPFIAIRAISDRADEALPACFAGFVDGEGRTKMSAVLAALILGRVGLRELLAAGRSSRLAHQALFRCRGAVAGLR